MFSRADLDGLKAAIAAAGNASEVRYNDGSSVRYMPIAEVRSLLQIMEQDVAKGDAAVAQATGAPTAPRAFRATFGSGW